MGLSLRQLRYFVATAEYGQISHAAVNLSISQSAVTAAIKDLELTVGVSLFNRTPQGMELTTAGRQFLSHAYEILAKVDEATHLNLVSSDIEGELVVAATYTVIGYFLPLHIERLRRLFPSLDVQFFELNRESIEEGLLTNRYDIAVLLTSNILNPALATERLLSSTRRLWVSARHHIARQPRRSGRVGAAAHLAGGAAIRGVHRSWYRGGRDLCPNILHPKRRSRFSEGCGGGCEYSRYSVQHG